MPRTVLQNVRDVALTVMAVLVSLVCALVLYFAIAAGSALAELGDNLDDDPTPAEDFTSVPGDGGACLGPNPPSWC